MGTLDPKVTGVLPITLGRACKLAGYFIRHDKTYVGILETHKVCDIKELQKLIDEKFVGRIKQVPPHRSAVARVEREREVYYWKLIEANENGKAFLFECKVEGGTYIRKLCSDLGEFIGGAHMGELRRTQAGIFDESLIVNLYDFEKAVKAWKNGNDSLLREMIVPAEDAIRKVLPVVEVDKSAVKSLYTGKPLLKSNVVGEVNIKKGESFVLFCGGVFIGVYRRSGTSRENRKLKIENRDNCIFGRVEFVKN